MYIVLECCSSSAAMTALTTATGCNEGARNLKSGKEGNLVYENMGVRTWPVATRVVRIFGVL
jgi:hypothetical protein